MAETQKDALLVIADISGYTRFMLKNAETISHAQAVITTLMNSILKEAKLPLQVAKLEGDAVFLFAADSGPKRWAADLEAVRQRLGRIFAAFHHKAEASHLGNTCDCDACTHVDHLKVKLVVHYGPTLFYKLGRFDELAGPDVIALHRLLKNSVESKEYLLITERAYQALGMDPADPLYPASEERYDDVGVIPVRVRSDLSAWQAEPDPRFREAASGQLAKMLGMAEKMWAMLVTAKGRAFQHLTQEP